MWSSAAIILTFNENRKMVFASINSHSAKIASAIKRNTRFSHHQRRKSICRFIRATPKRRQKILTAFSCRAAPCVRADLPETRAGFAALRPPLACGQVRARIVQSHQASAINGYWK
jgi:hypothetical protein